MPTITSLSPNSGPTSGGVNVIVTGAGFAAPWTVRFGTTTTTFTINVDHQIASIAPAGAVQVTATSSEVTSNGVCYVAIPALNSISPSRGIAAGGTTAQLHRDWPFNRHCGSYRLQHRRYLVRRRTGRPAYCARLDGDGDGTAHCRHGGCDR